MAGSFSRLSYSSRSSEVACQRAAVGPSHYPRRRKTPSFGSHYGGVFGDLNDSDNPPRRPHGDAVADPPNATDPGPAPTNRSSTTKSMNNTLTSDLAFNDHSMALTIDSLLQLRLMAVARNELPPEKPARAMAMHWGQLARHHGNSLYGTAWVPKAFPLNGLQQPAIL